MEFSAADVCVEGGSGAGGGQHGGHQAGEVYAADRAGVCRAGDGSGPAARRAERAHLRREDGQALVEHPGIDKVAFTGSTEVGRIIRKATANSTKKLSLELGGKSPFVVFDDADLDSAVEGLVDAIWFNQGQVCCAGSRLLVQERVAETLYTQSSARAWKRCASGRRSTRPSTLARSFRRCSLNPSARWSMPGVAEGAKCWQPSNSLPEKGCFFPPTLLTDVHPAATVVQEEIFGPVLVGMTFRTPAEAAELANNTVYGLAASIWSENINVALDLASQVKAGVVWVNCTNQFDAACGFGGYRESGYGREGGREGMLEYLTPKWLHTLPAARRNGGSIRLRRTKKTAI